MLSDLLKHIASNGGFLNETDIRSLAELDRMRLVLVRCNNGRLLCPAANAEWFSDLLESTGKEWVRDVSLPASDPIYRGDYDARTTVDPPFSSDRPDKTEKLKAWPAMAPNYGRHPAPRFNEAECGGAFDGFCVTSDADPGL